MNYRGTAGDDTWVGGFEDDHAEGLGGNDLLRGGLGNDEIYGGDGDDNLTGDQNDDYLDGGDGNDVLDGGEGWDTLIGGAGNDSLYDTSGAGSNELIGGSGDDLLYASSYTFEWWSNAYDAAALDGGEGNDLIYALGYLDIAAAGGAGNDRFFVDLDRLNSSSWPYPTGLIDAGEGNDEINLWAGGAYRLALGGGSDLLTLRDIALFQGLPTPVVVDFNPAADLIDFDLVQLVGWNGTTNPFTTGHLSLIQQGANVVLRVDLDAAGGTRMPFDLLTFENRQVAALATADIAGFMASGAAASPRTITGTDAGERIDGGGGNDVLVGQGGNDFLYGRSGNDRIEGGDGADRLDGGLGNDLLYGGGNEVGRDVLVDNSGGDDQLFGEGGADDLTVFRGTNAALSTVLLDGGDGADLLQFTSAAGRNDTANLFGGSGNDQVVVSGGGNVHVDAGTGDDRVTVNLSTAVNRVRLGTGADVLTIGGTLSGQWSTVTVSDFETGNSGDRLSIQPLLISRLTNWDQGNPFATGHLRLVQSGSDAVLQIDQDGPGSAQSFRDLLRFSGVDANLLNAFNLDGLPQDGSKAIGRTIQGTASNDFLGGTIGDDVMVGLAGNDNLNGRAGNDEIDGGVGNDQLFGEIGNDVLKGGEGEDTLAGGVGNDLLEGGGGDDVLDGGEGDDVLRGDAGNDDLVSRGGNDLLDGGDGYDSVDVSRAGTGPGETITVIGGAGGSYGGYDLRAVDTLLFTGKTGDDWLTIRSGAGTVDLRAGDDRIAFTSGRGIYNIALGSGLDTVEISGEVIPGQLQVTISDFGRADIFRITNFHRGFQLIQRGADVVVRFRSSDSGPASYFDVATLVSTRLENLAVDSSTIKFIGSILGTAASDVLRGTAGVQYLFGGAADDILDGGLGADESDGGAGDDVHFIDDAGDRIVERVGEGSDRVFAAINYRLTAGAEVELLSARDQLGAASLNLAGNEFGQALIGNEAGNNLDGLGGNDTLYGLGGNDVLDGGTGSDAMLGGGGDDLYYVDNAGDYIVEAAGEGYDRVIAAVDYRLSEGAAVELLTAANQAGTESLTLYGSAFSQAIIGNDGVNALYGMGGRDTLYGLGGNDVLDGGAGEDVANGGTGDDTYFVDSYGDMAIEAPAEGFDRVLTTATHWLRPGNEIELFATVDQNGTEAIHLRGNEFGQVIFGNQGVNSIEGEAGNDTLYGVGGNDVLDGGDGNDVLNGGDGADTFIFSTALGNRNVDTVVGFGGGDHIRLGSAVFAGMSPGALPAGAFVIGTAAQDADDRIVYDQESGRLYFDADGSGAGAAVLFAQFAAGTELHAGNFTVI